MAKYTVEKVRNPLAHTPSRLLECMAREPRRQTDG